MKVKNFLERTINVNTTINGGIRTVSLPFFQNVHFRKTNHSLSLALGNTEVAFIELTKNEALKIEEKLSNLSKNQSLDIGECSLVFLDTIEKPYETVVIMQCLYDGNGFDLDKVIEYFSS